MPQITYSTQLLFDNIKDKQRLLEILNVEQFVWNECSKVKFNIKKNSIVDLHAAFYKTFREQNQHIPSQVIIASERSVLSCYRSIKSNKHKISIPPIKNKLSLRLDKRTFSYKKGIFSIISLEKRIKCKALEYPKIKELLSKYQFCDPLLFERNGNIYICLTFKIPEILSTNKLAIGIDLGCRIPAATSEGNLFVDKKFNARKRSLRFLKRKLQSCRTRSAKRHLKKLRRKEKHVNKNFCHNLVNKILKSTNADTLVLENLKSIKVKKNKYKNNNRISQYPWYKLQEILTYKAPLYGKTVIKVAAAYTSQIDCRTDQYDGKRNGRVYVGKDGIHLDADINAACNIAKRSKLPCSIRNYFTWQATVNSPIVGVHS